MEETLRITELVFSPPPIPLYPTAIRQTKKAFTHLTAGIVTSVISFVIRCDVF